jgi:twinkle protein
VLTGIGNHGKSTFLKFLMINKTLLDGTKWAVFGPEDFPAHEFYHDLTEMIIGTNCTPSNPDKPSEDIYQTAYDYITKHVFYIYPKDLSPTPEYIKSRFLKLIMVEKVSGVIIDPFNQMVNDYQGSNGRDDKYLETTLADFSRFAIINNVFFVIVAHPHKLRKDGNEYPMPDVFDLAGGAMWNNKADNILVYHRPNWSKDPTDRTCEFHSRKIRRQKIVGIPGMVQFEYNRGQRRFVFQRCQINDVDLGYRPVKFLKTANIKDYSQSGTVEDDTPF